MPEKKITPSYYSTDEYFQKYLGNTSYYLTLQSAVDKLIRLADPHTVLELGSSIGSTTFLLADKYKDKEFIGVDIRQDIVNRTNSNALKPLNSQFQCADMCDFVKNSLDFDFIYMLYSFHHILDPIENKVEFLSNCFQNMKDGAYLLIAETFLPKGESINELFKRRSEEGRVSTFWNTLDDLSDNGLAIARNAGRVSQNSEKQAGEFVERRKDEYLVQFPWLTLIAKNIGFHIIIAEPVNALMDSILLLQK